MNMILYIRPKLLINMLPLQIQNWLISEDGIEWKGDPKIDYLISLNNL